jgi:hypothetical protein
MLGTIAMNLLSPPSAERNGVPDDLDRMLRAFYKAEMPHPWPAAPVAAPAVLPFRKPAARRPMLRARLALAASVALIALGSWLIPGMLQHDSGPNAAIPIKDSSANSNNGQPDPKDGAPSDFKINESLIQEPGGTTIRVDVIDLPKNPK